MEKHIEAYLRDRVKRMGGRAFKFTSPGHAGVPDRLLVMPHGVILFVEVKATGKTLRPLQRATINELLHLGARCEVVDSKEQVDKLMESLKQK